MNMSNQTSSSKWNRCNRSFHLGHVSVWMLSLSLLCSSISGTRNKEHEAGVNTPALSETSDTKLFVVLVIISEGTATRQLQTCLGHIRLLLPNFFRTAPVGKASLTQLLNKFLQDALNVFTCCPLQLKQTVSFLEPLLFHSNQNSLVLSDCRSGWGCRSELFSIWKLISTLHILSACSSGRTAVPDLTHEAPYNHPLCREHAAACPACLGAVWENWISTGQSFSVSQESFSDCSSSTSRCSTTHLRGKAPQSALVQVKMKHLFCKSVWSYSVCFLSSCVNMLHVQSA